METETRADLKQFRSVHTIVEVKNLTTGTVFKRDPVLTLSELSGEQLVLETPERSCSLNHHLFLSITVVDTAETGPASQAVLSATGKVVEMIDLNDGTARVSIKLVQFERIQLDVFVGMLAAKQASINNFLTAATGLYA